VRRRNTKFRIWHLAERGSGLWKNAHNVLITTQHFNSLVFFMLFFIHLKYSIFFKSNFKRKGTALLPYINYSLPSFSENKMDDIRKNKRLPWACPRFETPPHFAVEAKKIELQGPFFLLYSFFWGCCNLKSIYKFVTP